jgi:hypothetical protein
MVFPGILVLFLCLRCGPGKGPVYGTPLDSSRGPAVTGTRWCMPEGNRPSSSSQEGEAGIDGNNGAPFMEAKDAGRTRILERRESRRDRIVFCELGPGGPEGKLSRGGRTRSGRVLKPCSRAGSVKMRTSRRSLIGVSRTDVTKYERCWLRFEIKARSRDG